MNSSPPSETGETTAVHLFAGPGEMRALCRDLAWSTTLLGPPDGWSASLRTAAQLVLAHPFPNVVLWGPELVQIYNDGYRALMGVKHPAGLGQATRACWPEVWHLNAPVYERVRQGESVAFEDMLFPITRSGVLQDAWFTLSYSPVRDEAGHIVGVLVTVFETTERKRAEAAMRASEERQTFLLTLTDALRPLANPVEITAVTSEMLGRHLGVGRCGYAEVDANNECAVVEHDWTDGVMASVRGRHRYDDFGPAIIAAYRAGHAAIIDDATTDPRTRDAVDAYESIGSLRASLAVPLVKNGIWVACLHVQQSRPRHWTSDEESLVREVAERTWAAVERARAEAALRESEVRLQLALDAAQMGTFAWYVEGDVGDTDARTLALYGLEPGDPLNHTRGLAELVVPADRAAHTAKVARALDPAGDGVLRSEYRIRRASDGAERWIATLARAQFAGEPPVAVSIKGVSTDITASKLADAALRASDARFRTLVENVRDYAIFGLDSGGLVTEWTDGAERVKGYTAAEVIGQHLAFFFTPEDVQAGLVDRELMEAATTGRAEREGWRVRKGGERFWVNEIATAVRDAAGTLRGFTKISRDLTAQKLIEAERARVLVREQEARREAERAMGMRDEFLAVISHELRTPLSSILLWSRMLRSGVVPPTQQPKALASIETSASAQKKLIEDLLDVSSMLSGKVMLSRYEVALGPVLETAVTSAQPMATARRVTVTSDLGGHAIRACVDPDRLQQVVWNLVTNAVKFTSAGGHVTVRLGADERVVRIVVEDTGRGIAPDFLPHVFERFRQQDASITRLEGGLGLGLAIARQLVELHGGTIAVASAGEGRGATFTVELPRPEGGLTEDARASEADDPAAPLSFRPSAVLAGTRVLLVEDEDETRTVLQWLLEQCGAHVTTASSTAEALAAFDDSEGQAALRFDVLVSDLGLPGRDGYALLAALRQRPTGAALPALALTAYARTDDRQRVLDAGFNAYVAKPVEPRPLVETVAALVKGRTHPLRRAID